jgi:hypothetical protein
MGLLEVFNYGTGNDYYAKKQKELEDRYKTLSVAGGKVDMTIDRRTQNIVGPSIPYQKPPGIKIDPIQKPIPFDPSQGGTQQNLAQDPKWWEKLAGMANVDMDKAKASWKDKGGFEGLMANPAFTMGLAFMQSAAEGKTLGAGALDNVMKAAGISSHYKKIIESRKQEPIQATSADIAEVKSLLETMNIEDPSWIENAFGRVFKGENKQAMFDMAAEDIANALQIEMQKLQEANKGKTPLVFDTRRKLKILKRLEKEGKLKKKGGTLFTAATLETDVPIKTRATGGQVAQGKPYVVGEGGPEYFLPQESGKILSNDDSRIFAMLLSANPQLQNVSRTRAEKILRNRFPEYFE